MLRRTAALQIFYIDFEYRFWTSPTAHPAGRIARGANSHLHSESEVFSRCTQARTFRPFSLPFLRSRGLSKETFSPQDCARIDVCGRQRDTSASTILCHGADYGSRCCALELAACRRALVLQPSSTDNLSCSNLFWETDGEPHTHVFMKYTHLQTSFFILRLRKGLMSSLF